MPEHDSTCAYGVEEVWRPAVGHEGHYEVSSLGRVRSIPRLTTGVRNKWGTEHSRRVAGAILKQRLSRGYYVVFLVDSRSPAPVHRLVAESFLPPRDPQRRYVNHINGNKSDNRAANLEWVTAQENTLHAVKAGLHPSGDKNGSRTKPGSRPRGESHALAKLTAEVVLEIRNERAAGQTLRALSEKYEVSKSLVSKIAHRIVWRHL